MITLEYLKKKKWVFAILFMTSMILIIQLISLKKSHELGKEGLYSVTKKIVLDRKTKSGDTYKYDFVTSNNETYQGIYSITRLNKTVLDLDRQYYVVYSKRNPKINVLLIHKECCDTIELNRIIHQKVVNREWSYYEI